MKQDAFSKFLYRKGITSNKKQVQLQLSDSDNDQKSKDKPKTKQLRIDDIFKARKTVRDNPASLQSQHDGQRNASQSVRPRLLAREDEKHKKKQEIQMFPEDTKQILQCLNDAQKAKTQTEKHQKTLKQEIEVPIYVANTRKSQKQRAIEQQKRLQRLKKKQEKAEQERRKEQENMRRKTLTFKRFLKNIGNKNVQKVQENEKQADGNQLNNLLMFNKIVEGNGEQIDYQDQKKYDGVVSKINDGLVYKKLTTMVRQKIPSSFLKILLSYKFTVQFPTQQTKRVPNSFQDQMTYKKTFHYLVVNQCIADIHLRIQKICQGASSPSIPINISDFKNLPNGFIQFSMNQHLKQGKKDTQKQKNDKAEKQKIMLKNLSLSRNRLGLITNSKNFKFQHFGVPCEKNERIFAFLCMLVTPQSKQDLKTQVKGLSFINTDDLDIIFKKNKTNRAYFYDLQKISTHLRQYDAITYLFDTEVAPFIYDPLLIEKRHLEMIHQQERQMLEPILQKLKAEYNNTQYESIREMVLRESGIVLLQGPPGTGKTTTLMGLLAAEYEYLKNICHSQNKRKILICAPSNAAIDHITKRLVCQGLVSSSASNAQFSLDASRIQNKTRKSDDRIFPNILRVGIVQTDDPDIIKVSLDDICDKKIMEAKNSSIKQNNMTTTQIREKIISITKQINKTKNRKDLQEWEIQSKATALKYEIKHYQSLLFNFRKERIQLKQLYTQIQTKLFDDADIILTTLSSSGSEKMQKLRGYIGCLIVDEAAQSTEPNILIPFQSGVKKILLVGDPCQLPSTTMSQDSSVTLFNRSLFQRFLDNGIRPYFLNMQYRMAPLIREFPSVTFYNNRLVDAQSVIQRYNGSNHESSFLSQSNEKNRIKCIQQFFGRNSIFIDVKFGEEQFSSNSYKNVGQCIVVKNLLLSFIKKTKLSIGVITPYQSQKKYLIKQLKKQLAQNEELANQLQKYHETNKSNIIQENRNDQEQNSGILNDQMQAEQDVRSSESNQRKYKKQSENKNKKLHQKFKNKSKNKEQHIFDEKKNQQKTDSKQNNNEQTQNQNMKSLEQLLNERIMINTVDSFQGQEKDIIIVSTVRANNKREIGFMKDERRINVAITRSKHLLIVVGHGDTIGSNQIWNKLLEWSENKKCYYQIKQREGVASGIMKIHKGFNQDKIQRIRHARLTRDLRREQVQQIKRQDFGLGVKGKKKVKKQKHIVQQQAVNKDQKQQYKIREVDRQNMENEDDRKNQELMQEKRAREQQAINLEEVNKRLRQLEQRMAMNKNNPYANLFK